jgi:fructoselysine 6-kinase
MIAAAPRLVAVGDNCLDVYLTKDAMTVGGNALNVAVHWRRAGLAARYFGAVGRDGEGDVVLEEIARAGLAPADVERRAGHTAVTLIRERQGDRQFLLEDLGVGRDYMPSEPHYRIIAAADWVHLGTNACLGLVRRLVADRVPFSIDISTAHAALPLQDVPIVFASGPDDPGIPVTPLIDRLRAAGAMAVVVTCGARGAFFSDGSEVLHAPATEVPVVDTCGAGDSFIASFLAAFRGERRPAADALRAATADAATTCLYVGGFPQAPRKIPAWLLEKYAGVIGSAETA